MVYRGRLLRCRQILGVGQARNRTRVAVQPTVPFGLICLSLTVLWYACAGHAPADAAEHRSRARWYTTKTEPSFDDMTVKLRRVIIAASFRPKPTIRQTVKLRRVIIAASFRPKPTIRQPSRNPSRPRRLGRSRNMIGQKCETLENLWVPVIRSPHATCAYSWISPPSRSTRTIRMSAAGAAGEATLSGDACPSARCGRCSL